MNKSKNISPQEFEEIEQYLLKEMPEEHIRVFAKRIDSDQDLQIKVHTVRLMIAGIQENQLRHDLQKFHDEMEVSSKKTEPGKKVFHLKFILIAASVLIIAVLGIFLFLNNASKDERLYSEFYKPDSGLISSMGSSEDYIFDRAMIDYKTGNYQAAIQNWDSLLTQKPGSDTLRYFLASAYLASNQTEKAIDYFEKVISQTDSYFLEDASWYLGLALLKKNKTDSAIPFIEKSNHPDKEKLLDKLRK